MSEVRDLGQRYIAALWTAADSLGTDPTAVELLSGLVAAVEEAEAQLAGLRLHLLHEARMSAADAVVEGVRQSVRTTAGQAAAALRLAEDLEDRFPLIASALNEGQVSLAQAEAIVCGLRKLPARLSRAELVECQEAILAYTDELGPVELRTLAARLVEVIDPDLADADEAKRLKAEERAAHRTRFLRLSPDYHGSIRINGQLPVADAALVAAQLEALMPPATSYVDAGEPAGPDTRRADALVLLAQAAAASGTLPAHGGDRPQVHITLHYDTLTTGLGRVGLLGTPCGHDGLSAAEARRLACDAGLIPMVLGGASRPLDVGRTHRLFTPAIRSALLQRDRGCAFPGCTAAPATCEAHHITPWWAGGATCIDNAVLLCPHHHRLVEPDPLQPATSQWQVHLDPTTGSAWFTPPDHIDPRGRPRLHQRHRLRHLTPTSAGPPCPLEGADTSDPPDPGPPAYSGSDLEELIRKSAAIWAAAG